MKIMGIVEDMEEHSTNLNYKVHDGTGLLECKHWLDQGKVGKGKHEIRRNSFVQVIGVVRLYEGRKSIQVYDISCVEDFNAMTHHYLEAILIHVQRTRGPLVSKVNWGNTYISLRNSG